MDARITASFILSIFSLPLEDRGVALECKNQPSCPLPGKTAYAEPIFHIPIHAAVGTSVLFQRYITLPSLQALALSTGPLFSGKRCTGNQPCVRLCARTKGLLLELTIFIYCYFQCIMPVKQPILSLDHNILRFRCNYSHLNPYKLRFAVSGY
jgi:hypothetical protein